nr:immunoglobulin light chain junction region [Macaca mulatta]
CQQSFTYPYTF